MNSRCWIGFLALHHHHEASIHAHTSPFHAVRHLKIRLFKQKKEPNEKNNHILLRAICQSKQILYRYIYRKERYVIRNSKKQAIDEICTQVIRNNIGRDPIGYLMSLLLEKRPSRNLLYYPNNQNRIAMEIISLMSCLIFVAFRENKQFAE